MIRRIIIACLAALCLLSPPALADEETYSIFNSVEASPLADTAVNLFVSPRGDDAADGSVDAPLRTLQAAIDRLAARPSAEPSTIWLREGEHPIDETIVIQGPSLNGLAIRAYQGEQATLVGARRVEGWIETTYMGGLVWAAPHDAVSARALYSDTGALPPARWPKDGGYLTVARAQGAPADKFQNSDGFYVNAGDLPQTLIGATVRLLHWWKDELSGVRGLDTMKNYLYLNRPSSMTISAGDRYFLENVLGVTLAPGEWAYDRANGTLYYAPQANQMIEDTPVYIGTLERLVTISGVEGLSFDGVGFARTAWSIPGNDAYPDFQQAAYDAGAAIHISDARNVRFTGCTFEDIGAGCIRIDQNVKDAVVYGCTFRDIGAQAIFIHGANLPFESYITERIMIENNEIAGYGRSFYNAAAILIVHARDIDILHNDIRDGTYTGISAGWVWGEGYNVSNRIRIHNNWLHNIGQGLLSDMGAIYMLGEQPESFIAGNVVHDVVSHDYGGWGIYLDEGSSGILVENNLVYRCSAQGFHQNNGSDNTVRNNILAFSGDGQVGASGSAAFVLERNIIVGATPHLNREAGASVVTRNNIYRETADAFVNSAMGNFNLADDPTLLEGGFTPFVYFAGRYGYLY